MFWVERKPLTVAFTLGSILSTASIFLLVKSRTASRCSGSKEKLIFEYTSAAPRVVRFDLRLYSSCDALGQRRSREGFSRGRMRGLESRQVSRLIFTQVSSQINP